MADPSDTPAPARTRKPRRWLRRIVLGALGTLVALIALALIIAVIQGQREPEGQPRYVALGSSFAAGAGLGPLQKGSPVLCARSVGGYPQKLALLLDTPIVDMTCGGAVTDNLLTGGQFFQGPQIRAIMPDTELVTITVGGNDIGYVGDLSMLAARHDHSFFGWLVRRLWKGPKPVSERGFEALGTELSATLTAIRAKAPDATIVVATYPTLLPASGTCDRLGLTAEEVALMREVGDRLADTTIASARQSGATVVDMHRLGAAHNACSDAPWVHGWKEAGPAPFHPTSAGAEAVARSIQDALTAPPAR